MPVPPRDVPHQVLAAIGRLVVNYATLETMLRWLIADLLDADEHAAIATVKLQMRALIDTADALYWHRRPAIPARDWKRFVKRLEAIHQKRSALVHADWYRTVETKELRTISSRLRRGQGWVITSHPQSLASVRSAADEALELANDVHDMILRILPDPITSGWSPSSDHAAVSVTKTGRGSKTALALLPRSLLLSVQPW